MKTYYFGSQFLKTLIYLGLSGGGRKKNDVLGIFFNPPYLSSEGENDLKEGDFKKEGRGRVEIIF